MKQIFIKKLVSGGLITNYYCSSRCGHCLYGCSPKWKRLYIDKETASKNLRKIRSLGCRSVHIGGGEPFLEVPLLLDTVKTAAEEGVMVEYIETNSSWYRDEGSAIETLLSLKDLGISTLLVSISPFHNEHIPFRKVKGVIEACRRSGVSVFPWSRDFYEDLNAFDDTTVHSLDEYKQKFGEDYLRRIPDRYWLHYGGRSIKTFHEVLSGKDARELINETGGCSELTGTTHFHFDLFGNYIPGLCSGLAIQRDDIGLPLDQGKYPLLSLLYDNGVKGFFEFARDEYGFSPEGSYISKCGLCLDIRKFLATKTNLESSELKPVEFYYNV